MSLSGKERNHLFLNEGGSSFSDISGISGVDSINDGRSFAVWDFDRDGWQDILLANTNTPILHLYRNLLGSRESDGAQGGHVVAVRFVGGNQSARPSEEFSCRDGYGVRIVVELPDKTLTREHRCGEGFAAQNSNIMFIGIGQYDSVKGIELKWPSGVIQKVGQVAAGELITVYENKAETKDASGIERSRYLIGSSDVLLAETGSRKYKGLEFSQEESPASQLCMYTSMATWCVACRTHMPELAALRSRFDDEQLKMVGVPIDEEDDKQKLDRFIADTKPAYELTADWEVASRKKFQAIVNRYLGKDVIPATIITTGDGQVVEVIGGTPTVSDIARQLSD